MLPSSPAALLSSLCSLNSYGITISAIEDGDREGMSASTLNMNMCWQLDKDNGLHEREIAIATAQPPPPVQSHIAPAVQAAKLVRSAKQHKWKAPALQSTRQVTWGSGKSEVGASSPVGTPCLLFPWP